MAGRIPSLHLFPSSSQPSHRTLGTPPPSPPQQILYTEQKIDIHTKKRVPATRHNMLLTFHYADYMQNTHTNTEYIYKSCKIAGVYEESETCFFGPNMV